MCIALADTFFDCDAAILGKEAAAHTYHRMLLQEVLAESDLVYRSAIIPKGKCIGVLMLAHLFSP